MNFQQGNARQKRQINPVHAAGEHPCWNDLPLFTGEVLRDEGIKKVAEHNESWMERATKYVEDWSPLYDWYDFTGEDLRFMLNHKVGLPRHPNAYGALINTLVRRKIIKPTGEYRAMRDDSSHARKTPVYTK